MKPPRIYLLSQIDYVKSALGGGLFIANKRND